MTTRSIWRTRRIVASLALLVMASCHLRHPSPPTVSPRCDRPSTDDEVFAGLYSIYYRAAHLHSPGRELKEWAPVSLSKASHYLFCDPDRGRRLYRIRYATIKLAAAAVILQRESPHSKSLEVFTRALQTLGVSGALVRELAHSTAQRRGCIEDAAGNIIDSKPADHELARLQRTCCPCLDYCKSGTAAGGVAVVEFTIKVNREAQCLAHVVDPQCWKKVVPLNFNTDPQVVAGPACTASVPPEPTCRNGQTCNQPLLSAPTPLAMPPQPAAPWCGLLLEDVALAGGGITANTVNALGVRTTKTTVPYLYRMDYELCESRQWSATSGTTSSSGNCSIELDCGDVNVGDTGVAGNANLSGTKRIRFSEIFPSGANGWAPTALEVLATETATAACVAASSCPAAKLPGSCTASGSTAGDEPCKCDKSPDHCDGPFDTFNPAFDAPLCPKAGGP